MKNNAFMTSSQTGMAAALSLPTINRKMTGMLTMILIRMDNINPSTKIFDRTMSADIPSDSFR